MGRLESQKWHNGLHYLVWKDSGHQKERLSFTWHNILQNGWLLGWCLHKNRMWSVARIIYMEEINWHKGVSAAEQILQKCSTFQTKQQSDLQTSELVNGACGMLHVSFRLISELCWFGKFKKLCYSGLHIWFHIAGYFHGVLIFIIFMVFLATHKLFNPQNLHRMGNQVWHFQPLHSAC